MLDPGLNFASTRLELRRYQRLDESGRLVLAEKFVPNQ